MAVCLRRILKSENSVTLVIRKTGTNCVNNKNLFFARAFPNENTKVNFPPTNISCASSLTSNLSPFVFKNKIDLVHSPKFLAKEKKHLNNISLLNLIEQEKVLYCAQECKAYKKESKKIVDDLGKAEPEQVLHILDVLSSDLPKFFKKPINYSIYHKNIIFENNIKGTKTIGLQNYAKQVSLLRIFGHINFAAIDFDVLKITAHPEDGTVRVRWRIKGISNLKLLAASIKYLLLFKPITHEGWYDGFSIYYVRSDGLVHKHTVDKMVPDDKDKVCNFQNNIAAKIAFVLGVSVKEFSSSVLTMTSYVPTDQTYLSLKNISRFHISDYYESNQN